MKIVVISDTHEKHRKLEIPECDVLIHAGDVTTDFGKIAVNKKETFQDFIEWFDNQPAKHKLFIAGNHDFCLYYEEYKIRRDFERMIPDSITYLRDREKIIDGVKFWGTPWQPNYCSYAFNITEDEKRAEFINQIPLDTNVLITHAPPYGILDKIWTPPEEEWERPKKRNVGCKAIKSRISELKDLKLHVFGHIHQTSGLTKKSGIMYANAAMCGKIPYDIVHDPILFSFDGKEVNYLKG